MSPIQKRGSVLVQYLFSYVGIALLSCALIGVVIFNMYLQNLEQAELANNLQKVEIAAKDIEAQLDTMQAVSYAISFNIKYRPLYFQQNKYYEKLLLEDFSKYSGYSLISDQYFLLYHAGESAFLSTGFTSPTSVLFETILGINDPAAFNTQLNAVHTPVVIQTADSQPIFFAFPVRATADRTASENATLCFVSDPDKLLDRIAYITGGLKGDISLTVDGVRLTSYTNKTRDDEPILAAISPNGRVQMSLVLPWQSVYGKISSFRSINLIAIALFVLLLVGLAVLIAYRNFLPIKRINARFEKEGRNPELKNELLSIDRMLSQVQERNTRTTEQMAEQMRLLKGQSLHLLLSGDSSGSTLELLRQLGIKFPNECLTILQCCLPKRKAPLTDREEMALFTLIEDLSSENIVYYALKSKQREAIIVIINLKDESLLDEAVDLFNSMLGLREERFLLGLGTIYSSVHQLPAALIEAMSDCDKQVARGHTAVKNLKDPTDSLAYDTKQISRMLRAVRAGNSTEACSHLDDFIAQLQDVEPSLLLQRFIFSEVLVALVQTGRDLKLTVNQNQLSTVLTALDVSAFRDGVAIILNALCQKAGNIESDDAHDVSINVLNYIQAHYMAYDLSLDQLAQVFNLSANYLSRLIKQAAGENYKDYVIQLKIDQAKHLLESGLSVTQTCENVGYANISHFIKTFKLVTGQTPSTYKKGVLRENGTA